MAMTKTERLSHYAIMVVAVSALVVSVWQVKISQEHNKLSVRPYLDFFSGWQSDDTWVLILSNEGIGPAIVKSIEYTFEGKVYTHWDAILEASGLREYRLGSLNIGLNSPVATEKTMTLLSLRRTETQFRADTGVKMLIKYESIYQEPFELEINF